MVASTSPASRSGIFGPGPWQVREPSGGAARLVREPPAFHATAEMERHGAGLVK